MQTNAKQHRLATGGVSVWNGRSDETETCGTAIKLKRLPDWFTAVEWMREGIRVNVYF